MVNGSHFSACILVKRQIKPRSEVKLILARDREHQLRLWACRGNGRGCKRNRHRKGVLCEDCFGPLPEHLTLAEVEERLQRDA
jgi:hypothetical protein